MAVTKNFADVITFLDGCDCEPGADYMRAVQSEGRITPPRCFNL